MRQGERLWARSTVHTISSEASSKRKIADDQIAVALVTKIKM
jgi:hypothetical protein